MELDFEEELFILDTLHNILNVYSIFTVCALKAVYYSLWVIEGLHMNIVNGLTWPLLC